MFATFRFVLSLALVVAFVAPLVADELLVAPEEAPQYELTGIKRENDQFGFSMLVIDYRRVKQGTMPAANVSIAGKTKNGELTGFTAQTLQESGQIRLSLRGMLSHDGDFEIYLVLRGGWQKNYMISNAVRLGDPGAATTARAWTEEETKAAERAKLARTPPAALPAGFEAVTASTSLVPGMPIKAGSYAEWVDAEVIRTEGDGLVVVKFPTEERLQRMQREKWLAVDPAVLARAKANPSQFKVDIRTLPGSLLIIPEGANPLASGVELPPGTPLILDDDHLWKNIFVVEASGTSIKVRYDGFESNWDESKPRSKFVVKDETLELLKKPEEVKKLVKNLESPHARRTAEFEKTRKEMEANFEKHRKEIEDSIAESRRKMRIKEYPIDIPLPKRAQVVPADLDLEKGTPLAACWANRWHPLSVLHENDDGTVHVHWDERPAAFDCSIAREELIIEDKTVRKLRRKSALSASDFVNTLRTWTDVTGKHKIEAYFVRKTDSEVTLKTDAGRELTLPLAKLSEADRELVTKQETPVDDNPFK